MLEIYRYVPAAYPIQVLGRAIECLKTTYMSSFRLKRTFCQSSTYQHHEGVSLSRDSDINLSTHAKHLPEGFTFYHAFYSHSANPHRLSAYANPPKKPSRDPESTKTGATIAENEPNC